MTLGRLFLALSLVLSDKLGGLFIPHLQLCPTLCNSVDYSLPVFSVCGILQARILKWVAMPSSRGSSQPRYRTHLSYVSCIDRWVLGKLVPPGKLISLIDLCVHAKTFQLCPTLCDPMDCSPLRSSVHRILQARILEWIAMSSSRDLPAS